MKNNALDRFINAQSEEEEENEFLMFLSEMTQREEENALFMYQSAVIQEMRLLNAVENMDTEKILEEIKRGADIESLVDDLIINNDFKKLITCIKAGFNPIDVFNIAIQENKVEIIDFIFINYSEDINKNYLEKSMNKAIKENAFDVTLWLYNQGVYLDKEFAQANGNEKIQKWLLSLDLDSNLPISTHEVKKIKI